MARRLFMTSADYVAIAISPALIMALVGSLVFFLIEVAYVGEYQARLTYAFALFVFAAVLIARISIEMGSDRAAIFAVPLGVAMFLFLLKFVEHASPLSHVINLVLMGVVWWCAHKLTWDSTVIDDDEDASGEGLMQRIGVDGPERAEVADATDMTPSGAKENELLQTAELNRVLRRPWWQRLVLGKGGAHTPGVWVFYFSMAALPLFGIGQRFIPVADVGRRRYVFALLLVYVAAALSLLVTTSFLNLRRYLRQRRIEMPLSIAGNWVGVGAGIILLVMLFVMLIPRPSAEIAISKVPWQATSPGGLSASRVSVNRDGGEEQGEQRAATSGEKVSEGGQPGELQLSGQPSAGDTKSTEPGAKSESRTGGDEGQSGESERPSQNSNESGGESEGEGDDDYSNGEGSREGKSGQPNRQNEESNSSESNRIGQQGAESKPDGQAGRKSNEPYNATSQDDAATSPANIHQSQTPQPLSLIAPMVGGFAGLLKILLYLVLAIVVIFFAWRYRHEIVQALADILWQLREMFGGKRAAILAEQERTSTAAARRPSFHEFRDPFAAGHHATLPPEELVRYTFSAFEAWANDRGSPRSPDCTPQELISMAVEPETPMYAEARRLIRLYGQVAYASQRVSREAANELQTLWQIMRASHTAR
jgi:hypothetical protein